MKHLNQFITEYIIKKKLDKPIDSEDHYEYTPKTKNELIKNIKTKRYTYNKISRMLLHILTSFTKEEASNIDIDYIRILGFTTKGQEYLSKIKKNITIPIITGYKKNISKVLDIEYRVTKIYSLFTSNNLIKKEYQIKPIIKENND